MSRLVTGVLLTQSPQSLAMAPAGVVIEPSGLQCVWAPRPNLSALATQVVFEPNLDKHIDKRRAAQPVIFFKGRHEMVRHRPPPPSQHPPRCGTDP